MSKIHLTRNAYSTPNVFSLHLSQKGKGEIEHILTLEDAKTLLKLLPQVIQAIETKKQPMFIKRGPK